MYKRILVPVGHHLQSDLPVEYAVALAAFTGAELCFLQVLTLTVFASALYMEECTKPVIEGVIEASKHTCAFAIAAAEAVGVSYSVMLRWGALPDLIVQTAAEAACDLIVVGTPEGSGAYRYQSRYVVEKVIIQARQPVLVFGPALSFLSDPDHWSRFLVVLDDADKAETAIEYALTLAQGEAHNVCLLYVDRAPRPPLQGVSIRSCFKIIKLDFSVGYVFYKVPID